MEPAPAAEVPEHAPLPLDVTPTPQLQALLGEVKAQEEAWPWLFEGEDQPPPDAALLPVGRAATAQPTTTPSTQRPDTAREASVNEARKAESARLKKEFAARQRSGKYKSMLRQRERLPMYQLRKELLAAVASNQVVVISAETGAGKTTQVPQLLLDAAVTSGQGADVNIICTQPRRISAIGVADRVAAERCERTGQSVGYSIRLESKRSAETRLLFCTTGVLLRRLQGDGALRGVTHVCVDEVHERDLNTDFLLIILRRLLPSRPKLRLILMSATLNAQLFADYFGGAPAIHVPGRAFPVTAHTLEHVLDVTGYTCAPGSEYARKGKGGGGGKGPPPAVAEDDGSLAALRKAYPGRKAAFLDTLAAMDPEVINYDLIEATLRHIVSADPANRRSGTAAAAADEEASASAPAGAILVFMPGLAEIQKLYEQLTKAGGLFANKGKFVIHPLHSTLPTSQQKAVFDRPPPGVRKIVISTNIAETSITIDDVVYVVDVGKVKENRFDPSNRMASLVTTWVSQASAKQRRGRAGRVAAGYCYHLFSQHRWDAGLAEYTLPEMLRVPLDELVLSIRVLELGEVEAFLGSAVNPPEEEAVTSSLRALRGLQALDEGAGDQLTPLGYHLACLPIDPRLGKMILMGAVFGCLDPVLTIAAGLASRSPFMAPLDKRTESDKAKKAFCIGASDHLTLMNAYDKWRALAAEVAASKGSRGAWDDLRDFEFDNFLSRATLCTISEMKAQLFDLLVDIGFVQKPPSYRRFRPARGGGGKGRSWSSLVSDGVGADADAPWNRNASNHGLVKTVLCGGLYPNVTTFPPPPAAGGRSSAASSGTLALKTRSGPVQMHPSSVNADATAASFGACRYGVFFEKVKTSAVFLRDISPITAWPLLLTGAKLAVQYAAVQEATTSSSGRAVTLPSATSQGSDTVLVVDGWLYFRTPSPKVAAIARMLRGCLEGILRRKILQPDMDMSRDAEAEALIDALCSVLQASGDAAATPPPKPHASKQPQLRGMPPAAQPSRGPAAYPTSQASKGSKSRASKAPLPAERPSGHGSAGMSVTHAGGSISLGFSYGSSGSEPQPREASSRGGRGRSRGGGKGRRGRGGGRRR